LTDEETEQLKSFLRDHVSSIEELSILLFFVRSRRKPWSSSEVATALQLSEPAVESALVGLTAAAAPVERDPADPTSYRYAPSPGQEPLLSTLSRCYGEEPVTILQLMSSNAMERVRSATAKRLADAFRLDRNKK
jgi:hypothetical protein